jgi:exosome complex RNA-binding protein Rrp42 (RNase PH superfamily)
MPFQQNYLHEFLSKNVRPDGRPFIASRPVSIQTGILNRNSYGSAMVTLGDTDGETSSCTRVLAGCTLLVGRPSASTPRHGDFEVSVNASPLSGPRFDLGGRENVESSSVMIVSSRANDLEREVQLAHDDDGNNDMQQPPQPLDIKHLESYIRRTLRASSYINPEELCILPSKAAFRIRITVSILNAEGNVCDASLLCVCAALRDLRIPMVEVEEAGTGSVVRVVEGEDEDDSMGVSEVDRGQRKDGSGRKIQKGRKLKLDPVPVSTTLAILSHRDNSSNILVVDPSNFEEDMSHGNSITVICNSKEEVVNFSKSGSDRKLSLEEMSVVIKLGVERARRLEGLVAGEK